MALFFVPSLSMNDSLFADDSLARQLLDVTDLHEGLSLLAARLYNILPFQQLALLILPPDSSLTQVYVLAWDTSCILEHELTQHDELMDWLKTLPECIHSKSPDTITLHAALIGFLPSDCLHSLIKIQVAGLVLGLLVLVKTAEVVLDSSISHALLQVRAIWGLWFHRRLLSLKIFQLEARRSDEVHYLRNEIKTKHDLRSLSGESAVMKAVRLAIQQVARTNSTVLISGETGTGKELVARGIHQRSTRHQRLMVCVNGAALAPSLVASELFGHEAGAFTGATRRRVGRIELAHQGTLFLDEIAELPPEFQVLLLRVLQEKTIERVGGNASIHVDVRLLAATHQDLNQAVAAGRFRADLFYRLNIFPIHVPPLRERREDIPDLVRHFIQLFNRRMQKQIEGITPYALQLLLQYDWPGNVRELENLIERAMIVTEGRVLTIDPHWLQPIAERTNRPEPRRSLRDQEKRAILAALEDCLGKIYGQDGAAARLGLKPTTLYGKMRKHGISNWKNDAI